METVRAGLEWKADFKGLLGTFVGHADTYFKEKNLPVTSFEMPHYWGVNLNTHNVKVIYTIINSAKVKYVSVTSSPAMVPF